MRRGTLESDKSKMIEEKIRMVVKPAVMCLKCYSLEMVALTKREEAKLKMLDCFN